MSGPRDLGRCKGDAAKTILETAVKAVELEDLEARLRPSKRKDRPDEPSASGYSRGPAGSAGVEVQGRRLAQMTAAEVEAEMVRLQARYR